MGIFSRFIKSRQLETDSASVQRVLETARRASVFTRTHLEKLAHEGAIDLQTLQGIVKKHPMTVDKEKPELDFPSFPAQVSGESCTYYEVMEYLLAMIAKSLSPWEDTLQRFDPLKVGWFRHDDKEALSADLIVAILCVRNQALIGVFGESIGVAVEVRASTLVLDKVGQEAFGLYDSLKLTWLTALTELEIPQLKLASEIIRRSDIRLKLKPTENPLREIVVADLLIGTLYGFWKHSCRGVRLVSD